LAALAVSAASAVLATACDNEPAKTGPPEASAPAAPVTTAAPPPEPPRQPDIIVDAANVAVGGDRVPTSEPALADRVAVFVTGRPMVAGQTVDVVAMRNAKPSHVAAVVAALQRAKATGANMKTEGRDGATQKLPLSFTKNLADCTTIAWIAHDAAIDVWPAGGGTAKRVVRGLAGPDMTLGMDAVRKQSSGCGASELVVGADDGMTWGLVFDLASAALHLPGARASAAVLVTNATPGRKLARD
jgi:hypothetical protein